MNAPTDNNEEDNAMARDLDQRVTILETRLDTILPTLATKADLAELKADLAELKAELKAELHDSMAAMHKWIAGTCITLILGLAGLSFSMLTAVQATTQAVEQVAAAQRSGR